MFINAKTLENPRGQEPVVISKVVTQNFQGHDKAKSKVVYPITCTLRCAVSTGVTLNSPAKWCTASSIKPVNSFDAGVHALS